jgi:multiple sugar transport system permease protein
MSMTLATARRASVRGRSRTRILPYVLLSPAVLVTLLIVFLPMLQALVLSLHDFVLFRPNQMPFVGLGNFAKALADPVFWTSLLHTRAVVIIPWALPSVVIALMWRWIYDPNAGVLNDALVRLGLLQGAFPWLADPGTSLYAIILTLTWQGFPFFAVMILAGLQAVPHDLYEAAAIDGAGPWQQFWRITLPSIAGVIATAVLLRVIWVANSIDVIFVMTGGGPGYATHTLPLYAFIKARTNLDFGYGSALAVIFTLLLAGFVVVYLRRTTRAMD